jgi:hypothetical protein
MHRGQRCIDSVTELLSTRTPLTVGLHGEPTMRIGPPGKLAGGQRRGVARLHGQQHRQHTWRSVIGTQQGPQLVVAIGGPGVSERQLPQLLITNGSQVQVPEGTSSG